MIIGRLIWQIIGDASGINRELDRTKKKAKETGDAVDKNISQGSKSAEKGIGGLITKIGSVGAIAQGVMAYGVTQAMMKIVEAGSDAEETLNKFVVTFAGITDEANKAAAELNKYYGYSETAAQQALANVADLLQGFGVAKEKSLELAEAAAKLGADLASFNNYAGGAVGATEALAKAMLGEREQLKMLGTAITDAGLEEFARQQGKVWKEMSKGEQMALTLQLAMEQNKNAMGDYSRSVESFAYQWGELEKNFTDIVTKLGKAILPIATVIATYFNSLLDFIANFMDFIADGFNYVVKQIKLAGVQILKTVARISIGIAKTARKIGLDTISNKFVGLAETSLNASKRIKASMEVVGTSDKKIKPATNAIEELKNAIKNAGKQAKTDEEKFNDFVQGFTQWGSSITGILSAIQQYNSAVTNSMLQDLEYQMEQELQAKGLLEETEQARLAREYEEAKAKGDKELADEKKKELEAYKIKAKYEKKRRQLEYETNLINWKYQVATATAQVPIAVLNALSAGWKFGPALAALYATLAGTAAAIQLTAVVAAKPEPPKFQEGGIIPGNSFKGDNVPILANSGEMVLNARQQAELFDMINKGAGGMQHITIYLGTQKIFDELYQASKRGDLIIDKRAIAL